MSAYPKYEIWLSRDHARHLPVTSARAAERVRVVGDVDGDVHLECWRDGHWESRPSQSRRIVRLFDQEPEPFAPRRQPE